MNNWTARMNASRAARAVRINTRLVQYVDRVLRNTQLGVETRLKLAAQMTRDATVFNISRPVRKYKRMVRVMDPETGQIRVRSRIVVDETSRSKPGEFPKADTTRLMKDIFWDFDKGQMRVRIGTTLDYGLYLETRLDRSFLRKTFNRMLPWIRLIFTEHPTGGDISSAVSSASVSPDDTGE